MCCFVLAVQEPAAKNAEGNTPLHYACLNGHVAIVRQLMMNGGNASELNRYRNRLPLGPINASLAGQSEIAQRCFSTCSKPLQ